MVYSKLTKFDILSIGNRIGRYEEYQLLITTLIVSFWSIHCNFIRHLLYSFLHTFLAIPITVYYIKGDCYLYNLSVTLWESYFSGANQSSYLFHIIMQIDFYLYALCNFNVWKKWVLIKNCMTVKIDEN